MSTHAPGRITAFYINRRGAGCVRTVRDAAEAEKIMRGGYGAMSARLDDEDGNIVGQREKRVGENGRDFWFWSFDKDVFAKATGGAA